MRATQLYDKLCACFAFRFNEFSILFISSLLSRGHEGFLSPRKYSAYMDRVYTWKEYLSSYRCFSHGKYFYVTEFIHRQSHETDIHAMNFVRGTMTITRRAIFLCFFCFCLSTILLRFVDKFSVNSTAVNHVGYKNNKKHERIN